MLRSDVVQGFLSVHKSPRYLEVGVFKGGTFRPLKAERKVAVDPSFQFDVGSWRAAMPESEFHEVTSDDYFGSVISPDDTFDVIYLDGLHTSEQTLRDMLNAFSHLSRRGVIILDDIWPSSYAASLPSLERFGRVRRAERLESLEWMGDVYRLIPFIETFCQQWTFRAIPDNHGQLALWRERRPKTAERTIEDVGRYSYDEARLSREIFNFQPYIDTLEEYRRFVNG